MGGNKSKPVAESARTVLMRRGKEEVQKASESINTSAALPKDTISGEAASQQRGPLEMDPMILKEISKWSFVRSSDKPPKQVVTKGEPSAAIIRMKEIKERDGLSPSELKLKNVGRLSEDEMTALFKELRSDASSDNMLKLANKFRISQLNIEMLHQYARSAIVNPPKDGEVFPTAS